MTRLLLLTAVDTGDVVLAARPRLRDRLAARWRATRLDSALAAGAAPGERAALAIRAEALGGTRIRGVLAHGIHRVLAEARGSRRLYVGQVPLHRRGVLAATDQLEELAARLLAPGLLSVRGIAQVRLLLTDGRSPLYFGGATEELRAAVSRALADLEPTFGWCVECPD